MAVIYVFSTYRRQRAMLGIPGRSGSMRDDGNGVEGHLAGAPKNRLRAQMMDMIAQMTIANANPSAVRIAEPTQNRSASAQAASRDSTALVITSKSSARLFTGSTP